MADQKDTIYIDVDDEITSIIDKVENSTAKIVALVLPKRAAALQSIVNMKLLKRTADDSGKHVVLITSETALLPLAGAVGVYTAKNLQSKPEIPAAPSESTPKSDEESVDLAEASASSATSQKASKDSDTIMLGSKPSKTAGAKPKVKDSKDAKASKKPKVPNFEKFRLKLFAIIGGVVLLIVLWYLAVFVAPSAKIVITTDSEDINTSAEFTANVTATSVSASDGIVPAKLAEDDKEETQKVAATGEKDFGNKATGSVVMTAQECDSIDTPNNVPSGTSLSANGLNYTTDQAASFSFNGISGGCIHFKTSSINITAEKPGTNYNQNNASFAVSGRSDVDATGSTNGGTSRMAKVVSQQDVDNAKSKMTASDDAVKAELKKQLEDQGLFAIEATFSKADEKTTVSPKVGQEGSEVSVTYSAKYRMLGVKRDDIKAVLAESIKDQIDPERQQIQEDGLDQASFNLKDQQDDGSGRISISTIVAVGPNIDIEKLKQDVVGQKSGEAENTIRSLPGVKDVTVDPNPFWVNKVPGKPEKITVELSTE